VERDAQHCLRLAVLLGDALRRRLRGCSPLKPSAGDGGKCVPGGHNAVGVNDPQSSTEARAGHG